MTGKNLKCWNMRYKGKRTFHSAPVENTEHILKYTHPIATKQRKELLKEYDMQLIKIKTAYSLLRATIEELRTWRNNTNPPKLQFADKELRAVITQQPHIGWKVFLEGLV